MNIEEHDALLDYLRNRGWIGPDEQPRAADLPGGVSCRTVLVTRTEGPDLVLKQALEFLRVAEVWKGDPARVAREAEAMRVLNELLDAAQVPSLIFEDEDEHLIAMTAVTQPHENWKQVLLRGEVDRGLVEQFGAMLGTIHGSSSERAAELAPRFTDRSQFETLRVDPYYRFSAESLPGIAGWIDELIGETAQVGIALVHGDYSPKNVLIRENACVLLDHEVAHWGDPAFDIGFASAHFLGKANHLSDQRTDFAEAAVLFWHTYRRTVENQPWFDAVLPRIVRHTIACTLARVAGKSTLEYLSESERLRQRNVTVAMISDEPPTYEALIDRFAEEMN